MRERSAKRKIQTCRRRYGPGPQRAPWHTRIHQVPCGKHALRSPAVHAPSARAYCALKARRRVTASVAAAMNTPGIDIDFSKVLHGEQEIEIHRPLPAQAELESTASIPAIYDKGKAALIIVQVDTKEKNGDLLCTNRFSVFARGAGGFGADRGPHSSNKAPDGLAPDHVIETKTSPRQAYLYRLSGDMNPLHADPEVAKAAGFPRPILQGLCTFGLACKAVVDDVLDGDPTQITGYGVRFAGIFFPGETLITKVWKIDDKLLISSHSQERGDVVLSNAFMTVK